MLKSLHVKNYVLIDSLDIDFPEGLVIITGQTGAGKSIMIGALALVSGAKADPSSIAVGADSCVVEAEFDMGEADAFLRSTVEAGDVEWDGGRLIVRRVINRSGRSRAFINDCPVSIQVLSSVSSHLLDIHSQHQTLLLSDRGFQLKMLDSFAGNAAVLEEFGKSWERFNGLKADLKSITDSISRSLAEKEYNEALFRQLDEARLRSGEMEELEEEQKKLANAEDIKSALCSIESAFEGDMNGDSGSVSSTLKGIQRNLDRLSSFIGEASSFSSRVESCRLELDDIISELSSVNSDTEVSEGRLQEVEERLSLLYSLMRAFSCDSVAGLVAVRDSLSESISGMAVSDERRSEIGKEMQAESASLENAAKRLSEARKEAAGRLSSAIRDLVRSMELPDAEFSIGLEPSEKTPDGADSVSYSFSSTGRNLKDVSKCASGGEMSRIMLALKSIMARYANMPAMIFDEIDTGVSGSVADKMGSVICDMGKYMQVFAITHLPQVAAKGSAHYLVSKTTADGRTVSEIKRLSDKERVMEIARMLSGSVLTDAAVANAESLLAENQSSTREME